MITKMEDRRVNSTIIAISTVISLFIGFIGILSYIQSGERRTTQMEVKLEILIKQVEEIKDIAKAKRTNFMI